MILSLVSISCAYFIQSVGSKMLKVFVVLLLIVALGCQCEAAIDSDEVTSLPGWDGPLPSKQYSGYVEINATTGKTLHYWFVRN